MTSYPTNLCNSQWQIISKFLDVQRNRRYSLREIVNAIIYVIKTGCQWRMLPHDFPRWEIVYYYFSTWRDNSVWQQIHDSLVSKIRVIADRKEQPTVGIIDSQSVKCSLVNSEDKGFDAGKKIKGIKRHIIVDAMGLILAVAVQAASVQDRDGAKPVIEQLSLKYKRIKKIFADSGYRGRLIEWVKEKFRFRMKIVERPKTGKFEVLPKRWIVERTFAWLDTNRRNSKNYERLNNSCLAIIHLSAIRLMLNRF